MASNSNAPIPQIKIMDYPFAGPSNIQRSTQWDSQFSLNCYRQFDPVTNESAMYQYMGFQKIGEFEVEDNMFTGRAKGAIRTDEYSFFVIGDRVIRMDDNLNQTIVGELDTTTGPVDMDVVGQYIVIVDKAHQYNYNILTDTFAVETNPNAPLNPTAIASQQGFLLANDFETQTLKQTAIYNPSGYDALSQIQINYQSSPLSYPLIGLVSVNGRILCFTSGFTETLDNAGTAGFTFKPNINLTFGYGVVNNECIDVGNAGTVGQQQQTFASFLSNGGNGLFKFMTTTGNPPTIISTPSIDYRISNFKNVFDCVSNIISINGNTFCEYSFTDDDITLVYNATTKEWFDVSYLDGRSPVQAHVFFANRHLFSSFNDAGIYELSENIHTQNGYPMKVKRTTKNVRFPGYKKATVHRVIIWFEQGIGLPGNANPNASHFVYGSQPLVTLRVSYDAGKTYEQPQKASLGGIGEYGWSTVFEAQGTARDFTFDMEVQAPVPIYILGMQVYYQLSEGTQ